MAQISAERRERMNREKQQNASGGGNYFSFKNLTKAQIRLAPLSPDENIGTKIVYYFINNKSYLCNEQTNGKPGAIGATIRALQKLGTEEASELVEAFTSQRKFRYLMKIIDRYLQGEPLLVPAEPKLPTVFVEPAVVGEEELEHATRAVQPVLPAKGRRKNFNEVEQSLSEEQARAEARRCLRCDLAFTKDGHTACSQHAAVGDKTA